MDNKAIIFLAAGAAGLVLLMSKKSSAAAPPLPATKTPNVPVGKFFKLQEFLNSTIFPEVNRYRPTATDLRNIKFLVSSTLDPLREKYGAIVITGGGRPPAVATGKGTTWFDELKKRGLDPAKKSDHDDFSAADFKPLKVESVDTWKSLISDLRNNPNVRQMGFYLKTKEGGTAAIQHVHVAAVLPGHPKITSARHEFWRLDGKAIKVPSTFK